MHVLVARNYAIISYKDVLAYHYKTDHSMGEAKDRQCTYHFAFMWSRKDLEGTQHMECESTGAVLHVLDTDKVCIACYTSRLYR